MLGGSKNGKVYDLDSSKFIEEIMKKNNPERYYEEIYNPKPLTNGVVEETYRPTGKYINDCEVYLFESRVVGGSWQTQYEQK